MLNIFEFSQGWENVQSWLVYANKLFKKVLLATWEIFSHENNCNNNSHRFTYKLAFILFLSFIINQKQESGFQEVDDGLATRNISAFCL